jgi:hypothetical protein
MTGTHIDDLPSGQRRRIVLFAVVRTIATVALVVALYFLLPMTHGLDGATLTELVLGVLALFAIIAFQIRQILRSDRPGIRAVEALAFTVPLFILFFATAYFLMAHANAASFGGSLTRTDAMYFSTTVFTTVGFGDIVAKTQAARLVVTLQMILDLVILGVVLRLVVNAVNLSKQRHAASTEVSQNVQP